MGFKKRFQNHVHAKAAVYIAKEVATAVYFAHSGTQAPGKCLDSILDAISKAYSSKGDNCRVGLLELIEGENAFRFKAGYGYSSDGLANLRLPADPSCSVAGEAFVLRKAMNIPDVDQYKSFQRNPMSSRQYKSLLLRPILCPGGGKKDCLGILVIDALPVGYFDEDDVFISELFAHSVLPILLLERGGADNDRQRAVQ